MARSPSAQPTQVELEILKLLWEHGPSALGQIHQAVSRTSDRAYSTTRKMIQVMHQKGLVSSDDSVRPHLYAAAEPEDQTRLSLIEDIAKRAFDGSTKKLVMSLLSAERITVDEVHEMQKLIDQAKEEKK